MGLLLLTFAAGLSLTIIPVHASPTWPVLLDANSTGATDANPQSSNTPAKTFNLGLIIEANSTTPLNGVFGWQVGIIYDNTTLVPQGDPSPSSPTDGAANTVTFGAMAGTGQVNWAGMVAAGHAFGSSSFVDPKIDNHHQEIIVFFTIIDPNPAVNIFPTTSATIKGNLLANIAFEDVKPATSLPLTIDGNDVKFVGPGAPPTPISGIAAGGPVSVTISNNPPVASFTTAALPAGDASCTPITGAICSAFAIRFDASGSSDSDGTIANPAGYFWDFGDGLQDNVNNPGCGLLNCTQGAVAIHDYGGQAKLNATLRVVDNLGATGSARDALDTLILNLQPSHTFRTVTPGYDPTTTSVPCTPSPVEVDVSSTCTITVTDSAASGATAPTGMIVVTSDGSGTITTSPCTLANPTTNSVSCSISYTPSAIGTGIHKISAAYAGDTTHLGSSGSFNLAVIPHGTTTSVSCDSSIVLNQVSTCTATVTDTSTSPSAPTGTVTFTATGSASGSFSSNTCALANPTSSSSSCQVTFSPSTTGTANIGASYGGDSTHAASSTSSPASITVTLRTSSTSISCTSPIFLTQSSSCTATVTDTSVGGTPRSLTGSVDFSETGVPGSFDATSCTLTFASASAASCSVNFTPTAVGTASVSGTYTPNDSTHSGSSTPSPASITVDPPPPGFTTNIISCVSTVVVNQASVCTATVADIGPSPTTPAGTVAFTSTGSATGSFGSSSPCTLVAGATGTATCTGDFVASVTGAASISAAYTPSDTHTASSSSTSSSVTVNLRTTTSSVSCATPVDVGTASSCTVTVTDTSSGIAITPSGSSALTSNSTGSSFSGSCNLSGTGATATCTVSYTPITPGTHQITASYPGDVSHIASSDVFKITSRPLPPTLTVTGPSTANTGSTVTLNLASSGVGGASVTSIRVVWGDGSSENLSGTSTIATHTYSTVGSYNVTITATDSNGLSTPKSLTVSVTAPPPGTPLTTILLIAIPIILIAAGAFVLLRRRKKMPVAPQPAPRKK